MQELLSLLGYYEEKFTPDGYFRMTTVDALMRFQLSYMGVAWSDLFDSEGRYGGCGPNTSNWLSLLYDEYQGYKSVAAYTSVVEAMSSFVNKNKYRGSANERVINPACYYVLKNSGAYDKDWIYVNESFKYLWTGTVVTTEFKLKVLAICKDLGINPDDLMTVMAFESMGFNPKAGYEGAVGLIQIMPDTAIGLGTTTEQLSNMSAFEQLDYVKKHLEMQIKEYGQLRNLGDIYMAVFWPEGIGRDDSYIIAEKYGLYTSGIYEANRSLDFNNDGIIRRGETIDRLNDFRDRNYQINSNYKRGYVFGYY